MNTNDSQSHRGALTLASPPPHCISLSSSLILRRSLVLMPVIIIWFRSSSSLWLWSTSMLALMSPGTPKKTSKEDFKLETCPSPVSWAHATSWSWSWSGGWAEIEWGLSWTTDSSAASVLLPAKSWTISLCRSRSTSALRTHSHDLLAFISLLFLYFCVSVFCISFSRLDVFFGRRLRRGLSTTLRALFAFFDCFDS